MLLAGVAFRQQFLMGSLSAPDIAGCQGHLCNNAGPNLELTVDGPDRPLRFGGTIAGSTKKAAADAAAFHDPDNLAARPRAATIAS
jgi:hypothetical protein